MEPTVTAPPTAKEVELELTLGRFETRLSELAQDKRSLVDQLKVQSDKVIRLEAEVVRLRMTRTDAELSTQVDGLRKEVGKKDRELVDFRRELEKFRENEKVILHRAATADAKVATVQNTLVTMQRSRDAAQLEVEKHDRARTEAVTQMIAASDRARRAEEKLAGLEKKPTPTKVQPKK